MPPILLLLQLIAFDDEMDVAEVDHFTYYCDVHLSPTNSIDVLVFHVGFLAFQSPICVSSLVHFPAVCLLRVAPEFHGNK